LSDNDLLGIPGHGSLALPVHSQLSSDQRDYGTLRLQLQHLASDYPHEFGAQVKSAM